VIIGGTGLIGRAVARRLLPAGWMVELTGRDAARLPADLAAGGARFTSVDRGDATGLATVVGGGADLLVDCVCFTAAQARALLPFAHAATSTVMISSKAVYVDDDGHHANSDVTPRFAGPVTESQPTMAPGDMDHQSRAGYGANKVAAERVLLDGGPPVTVLRPSKVHGQGAPFPREWYSAKRALDRRPAVLLAAGGTGADHTTAAANLAALVEVVARRPGRRILNSADPTAPTGLDIARAVGAAAGHTFEEVLLDGDAPPALGRHPWHRLPPCVLDTAAADSLGYRPVGDYASTVAEEIDWLVRDHRRGEGGARLPPGVDDGPFLGRFDYAAEDVYVASR
jgi:nucleoside-diphosphate-sugar epimerase